MKWHQLVSHYCLSPHPEGGYFRELLRHSSHGTLQTGGGQEPFESLATHILYLLPRGEISHLHRLQEVEMWHYYQGDALRLHLLEDHGSRTVLIGTCLTGETPFHAVPSGTWFAAETTGEYSLVGCTVVPGFSFDHFQMASRSSLLETFPESRATIVKFTKPN
ncbi:cupin domain-containing protein [Myxococcota bacterium]|nr:cupin domain-containing protein [Myxococcota bacterium]